MVGSFDTLIRLAKGLVIALTTMINIFVAIAMLLHRVAFGVTRVTSVVNTRWAEHERVTMRQSQAPVLMESLR